MENTGSNAEKLILKSPQSIYYQFEIVVKNGNDTYNELPVFDITYRDTITGAQKKSIYKLPDREHHSYLDFFDKLSKDFSLRIPGNRKENTPGTSSAFDCVYNEVLTDNITPEILYGYGDPAIIRVDNARQTTYYLLATSNDAPNSFPLLRSTDLKHWEFVNFVFPHNNKPSWAANGGNVSDYWAPEMHKVGNEFRIYYVARYKVSNELCIGMAKSPHPEGPFSPDIQPILKGNIIDPHVFVKDSETAYLYWKEDNNDLWPGYLVELLYVNPHLIEELFTEKSDQITASFIITLWPWAKTLLPMERFLVLQLFIEAVIDRYPAIYNHLKTLFNKHSGLAKNLIQNVLRYMRTPMYAQRLSPDGSMLIDDPIKILENDLEWEAHLVEGMWVTKHEDNYYLFYAGNDFSTDKYGIGLATAKTPLGPYTKAQTPFLRSTKKWWAPGHPSVVTGPDGTSLIFLHAYFPGKAGYKEFRALLSVPIKFQDDKVSIVQ